ncbi:hypothetical protein ACH5RR_006065 [Cinchona calisaya]|uniref:Uncharacterized protein n=1 Tax=Cinchona calisaya TaxID=153742 RepID=A0ABD3AN24_9GENT
MLGNRKQMLGNRKQTLVEIGLSLGHQEVCLLYSVGLEVLLACPIEKMCLFVILCGMEMMEAATSSLNEVELIEFCYLIKKRAPHRYLAGEWLCTPDRSYCVCGPPIKGVGNDDIFETKSLFSVQVVQEARRRPLTTRLTTKSTLAGAATDSAGCHRDSVLSLASVKLNQRRLISSSRDGAIKVWK